MIKKEICHSLVKAKINPVDDEEAIDEMILAYFEEMKEQIFEKARSDLIETLKDCKIDLDV